MCKQTEALKVGGPAACRGVTVTVMDETLPACYPSVTGLGQYTHRQTWDVGPVGEQGAGSWASVGSDVGPSLTARGLPAGLSAY